MAQDGTAPEKKKLDLSVAQIAGSSLATVAAALLASKLGVYGTILGAGVVSVVATAGGPVIQHVFRSTGDRLRTGGRLRTGDRLRTGARPEAGPPRPPAAGEFGGATVHGTRVRGWKRTALASGAAFALAIGGLGVYEAAAGTSVSDGGGTLLSGGTRKAADHRQSPPEREDGKDGKDGKGGGASPDPGRSRGGRNPEPDPAPSRPADRTPTPTPSPPEPDPVPTPKPTPTPSSSPTPAPVPTPGSS
ncbi:hypothetical protein ACIGQE_11115 [Streptomyces sp. NPDC053429]|uniref:hypothetical protein n=1 Tax=Streptomyces sp. NPDC053429 TaxID=3365702 RepID=UPI0037D56903